MCTQVVESYLAISPNLLVLAILPITTTFIYVNKTLLSIKTLNEVLRGSLPATSTFINIRKMTQKSGALISVERIWRNYLWWATCIVVQRRATNGWSEVLHGKRHEEHWCSSHGGLRYLVPNLRVTSLPAAATGRDQQLRRLYSGSSRCGRLLGVVGVLSDGAGHPRANGTVTIGGGRTTRLPNRARVHANQAVTHEDRWRSQGSCLKVSGAGGTLLLHHRQQLTTRWSQAMTRAKDHASTTTGLCVVMSRGASLNFAGGVYGECAFLLCRVRSITPCVYSRWEHGAILLAAAR